jgi:PAS domain S-box-containing protein
VGRNYIDICDTVASPDAARNPAVAVALRAVLAGERSTLSIEYPCDSPQEQRRFLLTAAPLEAGRRAGAVIMHVDITDRVRAEQAHLHSAELLPAVADGTPDIVFVKDLEGRYGLCNTALARFPGRAVEHILSHDDRALYGAAEASKTIENDRRLLASGEAHASEESLTGPGGRRTFNSARAPFRNAQGEVIGVICIARDITDDKRAHQALRDSEAILDMAGRVAKVGGWRLDTIHRHLHWSDIVASLHDEPAGYSPSLEEALNPSSPNTAPVSARPSNAVPSSVCPTTWRLKRSRPRGAVSGCAPWARRFGMMRAASCTSRARCRTSPNASWPRWTHRNWPRGSRTHWRASPTASSPWTGSGASRMSTARQRACGGGLATCCWDR